MGSYLVPFALIAVYFFPSWLAGHRRHHNVGSIFMLNLLLGWTAIGWIAAAIWAASAVDQSRVSANEETAEQAAKRITPGWIRK